jgi:ureidoglycolate lyase
MNPVNLRALPVTPAAFAPFGVVVQHASGAPIADAGSAFVADPVARQPVMEWVQLAESVAFPLAVTRLEHHPFSAQTFLPHSGSPFLVVVAPSLADGNPDVAGACAFIVPATSGITFHAKVWHRSLAPLSAPSAFIMAMMRTGRDNDTVFHDLVTVIEVQP